MRLSEITFTEAKPVDGYGQGYFRIGGQVFEGGVVTGPAGTKPWGGYADIEGLAALRDEVDVLFVGTGGDVAHVPQAFRATLEGMGLGLEAMASPAAARTYNILLSEGRRIALAMLPVSGVRTQPHPTDTQIP